MKKALLILATYLICCLVIFAVCGMGYTIYQMATKKTDVDLRKPINWDKPKTHNHETNLN